MTTPHDASADPSRSNTRPAKPAANMDTPELFERQRILAGREPWQLGREEYLAYLATLDPQEWFDETEDWGEIVRCEFDALAKRLIIEYDLQKHEPPHLHTLTFEGVRAVYFESGRDGRLVGGNDRIAWDTSTFRQTGVGIITTSADDMHVFDGESRNRNYIEWLHTIPSGAPNFILSLAAFHESLSVEASRLTIDQHVFEVGYPTSWHEN